MRNVGDTEVVRKPRPSAPIQHQDTGKDTHEEDAHVVQEVQYFQLFQPGEDHMHRMEENGAADVVEVVEGFHWTVRMGRDAYEKRTGRRSNNMESYTQTARLRASLTATALNDAVDHHLTRVTMSADNFEDIGSHPNKRTHLESQFEIQQSFGTQIHTAAVQVRGQLRWDPLGPVWLYQLLSLHSIASRRVEQ